MLLNDVLYAVACFSSVQNATLYIHVDDTCWPVRWIELGESPDYAQEMGTMDPGTTVGDYGWHRKGRAVCRIPDASLIR